MASKKKKSTKLQEGSRLVWPQSPQTRGISRIPLSAVLARNLFPYPLPLSSSPTTVSTPVSLLSQRISVPQQPPILGGSLPRSPSHMPTRLISPLVHFPSAGNSGSVSQIPSNRDTIKKESTSFFCVCVGVCFHVSGINLRALKHLFVCPLINNQPLGPDPTRLGPLLHRPPTHLILDSVLQDPTPASQRVTHSLILSRQTVSMIDPREWNREREQTKKKLAI